MRKLYLMIVTILFYQLSPFKTQAQSCSGFFATCISYESRCAATGSIKMNAGGGSGNYQYKVTGPVSTSFTSTDSITGLSAGVYTVTVNDINSNCTVTINNVIVPGSYADPRFTLNSVDVSCDNGNNGRINLATQNFGRAPFTYSIVAPSPMGIGTINSTGTFNNLIAGVYSIRLTDSCGGIQTRLVTIQNYTWKIDSVRFQKISCDSASGYIRVSDSRGNISTVTGIPGLLYGVVRTAGDTIWSSNPNFTFYLGSQNNFEAIVKDPCGKIKKFPVAVNFEPSVGNTVHTYDFTCNSFSANLSNVVNFSGTQFCLFDDNNVQIDCNSNGLFTNLIYGSYCISAHDSCSDTTITRCFTATPPPVSVANDVYISNKTCTGFTASITGQIGLTGPQYCLYDSAANQLECNATGVFNNLAYGNYCISIKDSCRDTTLQRCFTAGKPVPVVSPDISPSYYTCTAFGVTVTGDSLTNPLFCLVDTAGNIIYCNNTGVFDSVAYGNYCISVYDSCYDTTIVRCISVAGPEVINTYTSEISNRACSTFTATVFNSNLIGPQYCLYKSSDSTLVACNSTGIFDSLAYGAYYVTAHNKCPDTSFIYDIAAYPPLPSLGANVSISNRTCSSFSVNVSGQQNLNNPQYCLYDSSNVLISCNTTGIFSGLQYGSYCIAMDDGCYDTVITRCFSAQPVPIGLSVSSRKSCNYGFAVLSISITSGVAPYLVKVIKPDGSELISSVYNTASISIDTVPGLQSGEVYTIIVSDNCGGLDSVKNSVTPSIVTHAARVIPKCPSSTWVNGSGTIEATAASNTASLTVRIIKKDNVTLSSQISPSDVNGTVSTFNNLGPGSYIIRYRINDRCNKYLYDTVTVPAYQYPSLDRSSAYQCDNNGFSVGAVVSNGVGPYMYEIIGSTPATPAIITSPQSNPVFSINNGAVYSLIRLRVVDACGNATLEDASVLPLANNGITNNYNCFQISTTLSVDAIAAATYAWYKKHTVNDADSIFIDSTQSVYLPFVLPVDTGLYVCHLNVNNGCIKRSYYYRLDGSCYNYLPVSLQEFNGQYHENNVLLHWKMASAEGIKRFEVERKINKNFKQVGVVYVPVDPPSGAQYLFTDVLPDPTLNYYRLKIVRYNNSVEYSDIVILNRLSGQAFASIYPNPVQESIKVDFMQGHRYGIQLATVAGKVVTQMFHDAGLSKTLVINRPQAAGAGIYILKISDLTKGVEMAQKIIFR